VDPAPVRRYCKGVEIQTRIEKKLRTALAPTVLQVINESASHNVPRGSETHFKVVLVSPAFEDLGRVARHRLVFDALAEELKTGVHALALTLRTPDEWETEAGSTVLVSPPCLGGSKSG
jgi:stress-induced morphogen